MWTILQGDRSKCWILLMHVVQTFKCVFRHVSNQNNFNTLILFNRVGLCHYWGQIDAWLRFQDTFSVLLMFCFVQQNGLFQWWAGAGVGKKCLYLNTVLRYPSCTLNIYGLWDLNSIYTFYFTSKSHYWLMFALQNES